MKKIEPTKDVIDSFASAFHSRDYTDVEIALNISEHIAFDKMRWKDIEELCKSMDKDLKSTHFGYSSETRDLILPWRKLIEYLTELWHRGLVRTFKSSMKQKKCKHVFYETLYKLLEINKQTNKYPKLIRAYKKYICQTNN